MPQRIAAVVTAALVAAVSALICSAEGLVRIHERSARAGNVVIEYVEPTPTGMLSAILGARSSPMSPPDVTELRAVLDGLHPEAVSAEYLTFVPWSRPDQVPIRIDNVSIHGVDPTGFAIHDVRLARGRMPAAGEVGVLVGRKLSEKLGGMELGGSVKVGTHRWPIIGVVEAPGTIFESELWCDRRALVREYAEADASAVTARFAEGVTVASLRAAFQRFGSKYSIRSEHEAYREKVDRLILHPVMQGRIAYCVMTLVWLAVALTVLRARRWVVLLLPLSAIGSMILVTALTLDISYRLPVIVFRPYFSVRLLCATAGFFATAIALGTCASAIVARLTDGVVVRQARRLAIVILWFAIAATTATTVSALTRVAAFHAAMKNESFISVGPARGVFDTTTYPKALVEASARLLGVGPSVEVFRYSLGGPMSDDGRGHHFLTHAASEHWFEYLLRPPFFGNVPSAGLARWASEPDGVLVSSPLQRATSWAIGEIVDVHNPAFDGRVARVRISGVFDMDFDNPKMVFHPEHLNSVLQEPQGPRFNSFAVQCAPLGRACDPQRVRELSRDIEELASKSGLEAEASTPDAIIDQSFRFTKEVPAYLFVASVLGGLCAWLLIASLHVPRSKRPHEILLLCTVGSMLGSVVPWARFHQDGLDLTMAFLSNVPVTTTSAAIALSVSLLLGVLTMLLHRRGFVGSHVS